MWFAVKTRQKLIYQAKKMHNLGSRLSIREVLLKCHKPKIFIGLVIFFFFKAKPPYSHWSTLAQYEYTYVIPEGPLGKVEITIVFGATTLRAIIFKVLLGFCASNFLSAH